MRVFVDSSMLAPLYRMIDSRVAVRSVRGTMRGFRNISLRIYSYNKFKGSFTVFFLLFYHHILNRSFVWTICDNYDGNVPLEVMATCRLLAVFIAMSRIVWSARRSTACMKGSLLRVPVTYLFLSSQKTHTLLYTAEFSSAPFVAMIALVLSFPLHFKLILAFLSRFLAVSVTFCV